MSGHWENALPGPDWMDIHRRVYDMQHVHRVSIVLGISCTGWALQPKFTFTCAAFSLLELDVDGIEVAGVSADWPCNAHKTLESCIHNALYRLDWALSQAYKQNSF